MSQANLFEDMSYIPRGEELTHEFLVEVGKRVMASTINSIDGFECKPEHVQSEQQVDGTSRKSGRSDFSAETEGYIAIGEAKSSATDASDDHAKQELTGYIESLLSASQARKFLILVAPFEFSYLLYNTFEKALSKFPESERTRFAKEVEVIEATELSGRDVIPPYCNGSREEAEKIFAPLREGIPDFRNYSAGRVKGVRKTLPISVLLYDGRNKRIFGEGEDLSQEECAHRIHSERYVSKTHAKKVRSRRREMMAAGQIKDALVVYENADMPGFYTVIDGNSRLFYARFIAGMAGYAPGYVEVPAFIVDAECVDLAEKCKYEEQNATVLPHSYIMDAITCYHLSEAGEDYESIANQLAVAGGAKVAEGSVETLKWLKKHYHTPLEFDYLEHIYDVAYQCAFNIAGHNWSGMSKKTSIKSLSQSNIAKKVFEHCRNNADKGWLEKSNFSMIAKIVNTNNRPAWKVAAFDNWYKMKKGWYTPAEFKMNFEAAQEDAKQKMKKGVEYYKDQMKKSNAIIDRVVEMLDDSIELRRQGTEEKAPYGCKDDDINYLVNQLSRMAHRMERDYSRLTEDMDALGLEW